MADKRPALGRGLSALIPDAPVVPATSERALEVDIDLLRPNRDQPRTAMDDSKIEELARSIKSNGIIQPIVVRKTPEGYEIVAGERRWRASQRAGLAKVPVVVRDIPEERMLAAALIENIQREDLNPLDRALAYQALIQHLGLTQAELAGRLGEDRSTVTHFLRLLDLPEPVQQLVGDGRLSMAHAKLLSGVATPAEQQRLAELTVAQTLSVRNLEQLVQGDAAAKPAAPPPSAHLKELERSLCRQLNLRVQVRGSRKKGHGRLVLHYSSLDQFDDLMTRLGVRTDLE